MPTPSTTLTTVQDFVEAIERNVASMYVDEITFDQFRANQFSIWDAASALGIRQKVMNVIASVQNTGA